MPKTCPESITSNLLHHYDPTLSHHHLLPRLLQWLPCSFTYVSHTPLKFIFLIKSIIIFIFWIIKLCWFGPGVLFFTSFLIIPTFPYYYFAILPSLCPSNTSSLFPPVGFYTNSLASVCSALLSEYQMLDSSLTLKFFLQKVTPSIVTSQPLLTTFFSWHLISFHSIFLCYLPQLFIHLCIFSPPLECKF